MRYIDYSQHTCCDAGVKVAPTFQLYKGGDKVAEMTGAKVEDLQELITKHG